MSKGYEPCYIIWQTNTIDNIDTIKVVVWSEEVATKEVVRLNKLTNKNNSLFPDEYWFERSRAQKR